MRLVTFLIWLLAPATAFADPTIFTAIAFSVAGVGVTYGTVAAFALTVGQAVYGSAQARKQARKARNEFNAGLQDRTVSNITTEAPYRYVYGRAKVGSTIVALFTSGPKDNFKHLVCVHAAHECDGIEEVYVAGKALGPLDANGWVTSGEYFSTRTEVRSQVTTANGITMDQIPVGPVTLTMISEATDTEQFVSDAELPYTLVGNVLVFDNPSAKRVTATYTYSVGTPRCRVIKHLGTPDDGVDPGLFNDTGGAWTANDMLRGFCYTVVTLDLIQPEFQGGPPSVDVLIRGKKVVDPRNGLTQWTDLVAPIIYDYLTGELCRIPAGDIPLADYITATNVCDEDIGGGRRYTFNGVVTADQAPGPVLEKMAQAMAGGIVGTTWSIWAGKYIAPVMALQMSDVVGSLAVTPGTSDADKFNGVKGQYVSYETSYVATDFKPYVNQAYKTADGDEYWTNIDFPYTNTLQRVHNLARIFTEDQRNSYTVKGTFSLKAWGLKPGQRVTLNSSLFGWTNKIFRVTDKSYSPSSMVELTLKEDAPSIWDQADSVVVDDTINSDLPNPFVVAPLLRFNELQSGTKTLLRQGDGTITSRIYVSFPASNQSETVIEIEWALVGSDVWQRVQIDGNATAVYISPVQDGRTYVVRGRVARLSINAYSDWVYATHRVIGKEELPPNVETLSLTNGVLSWPPVLNTPDLAGYLIRFHYGQNSTWSNANLLAGGVVTNSPYKPDLIPPGTVTIMIKAVDTTGNQSLNSADVTANLGDAIVENVILTYDEKAAGFPGIKTNSAVIGGNLLANDSGSLFWNGDNDPHFGMNDAPYWKPITYLALEYTFDYLVSATEAGSRMTLVTDIESASYSIEFRYGAPGPFWEANSALHWTEDGAKYWASPSAWQAWPGAIENIGQVEIGFRIIAQAGVMRSAINALQLKFDVPDETEELNNVAIAATGTRLPITKLYRSIENVQLTLQGSGGSAVSARCVDKNAVSGPLIYCLNSSGAAVAGVVDARIQGVKK